MSVVMFPALLLKFLKPQAPYFAIKVWIFSCTLLTLAMVFLGGATRLSEAGLSIVEWKPLSGIIPPLTDIQWQTEFNYYKQFPEYKLKHMLITLVDFKFIFYMEYAHRLLGRILGLAFILPLVFFWRFFEASMKKRALLFLGLGCAQGLMGWLMVKSGLVANPYVSHYRLAMHFFLALILYVGLMDSFFRLRLSPMEPIYASKMILHSTSLFLILTILYGTFTAGLRAGYMYNTFPLMGDRWIPGEFFFYAPTISNFFENPAAVQWIHRALATITLILSTILGYTLYQNQYKKEAFWILGAVSLQYILGITTVLFIVPPVLGVMHQGGAFFMLTVLLVLKIRSHSLPSLEKKEQYPAPLPKVG